MSDSGERILKERLQNLFNEDFIIFPSVKGRSILHNDHVVEIDFVFYPKQHLVDAGFDPILFGVEVKHFGEKLELGKMSRFMCQCISYAQSEFQVDGEYSRLAFVLGYSDIENAISLSENQCAGVEWLSLKHIAGLMNVGVLEEYLSKRNASFLGWYIRFITSTWFYKNRGRLSKDKNYNIYKINVGNCSN